MYCIFSSQPSSSLQHLIFTVNRPMTDLFMTTVASFFLPLFSSLQCYWSLCFHSCPFLFHATTSPLLPVLFSPSAFAFSRDPGLHLFAHSPGPRPPFQPPQSYPVWLTLSISSRSILNIGASMPYNTVSHLIRHLPLQGLWTSHHIHSSNFCVMHPPSPALTSCCKYVFPCVKYTFIMYLKFYDYYEL